MSNKRKFKQRERISGVRDARLIVVVTEGSKTEPKYFREMASQKYYYNPKVKLYVIEKEDNSASAPEHVIEELNGFNQKYDLEEDDEFWLVIDVDSWGDEKLSQIAAACIQKNFYLAVSNPCFEIWLLLHLKSLDEYRNETLGEFLENKKVNGGRTRVDAELLKILGQFNKSNLNVDCFLPNLNEAIKRAEDLDTYPDHRWPNEIGSRVYLLAKRIIN